MSTSLFLAEAVPAQDRTGLAGDADGFALPDPDRVLEFPADHGPHPDFRIEWWYVTANLDGPDGTPFGIQWTLFRAALSPGEGDGWSSPQIWFAHAALSTAKTHVFAERFARGGIGQAGVTAAPFAAWIDEWRMEGDTIGEVRLTAATGDFAYDLRLSAAGPLALHGAAGYSVKSSEGQASHYYSQPLYKVAGTLTVPDGEVPVTGDAWLDHEWSSQPLSDRQLGWDWFSLHFENGAALMGAQMRQRDSPPFTAATWIAPDGTASPLPEGALSAEPLLRSSVAGVEVPTAWRLTLPERQIDVEVHALNPAAWNNTYWEGPVRVTGSHRGRGYLEMTGYD